MINFILGFIIGSISSIILYALILINKKEGDN